MQLHALDNNEHLVNARHARKQIDYYCLECQGTVRLRSGLQRQPHFYHLDPTPLCRQHQKGIVHIQLQSYFLQQLGNRDCQLECPFKEIGRIADVAWFSEKIVFEIQFSPISKEEVIARSRDYRKMGWEIVWVLHDAKFNQRRLSGAETVLRSSPHFFSNFNSSGEGIIYDQFAICERGVRYHKLPPLAIDISQIVRLPHQTHTMNLKALQERERNWTLSFAGDLFHSNSEYVLEALKRERDFYKHARGLFLRGLPKKIWEKVCVAPYQIAFRFLLERMCR